MPRRRSHPCSIDAIILVLGWACILIYFGILFSPSLVKGTPVYIISPLPSTSNPCVRFQSTDPLCEPIIANWSQDGDIYQHRPDLNQASQFEHCVDHSTELEFAFGCVNDLHLESIHTTLPLPTNKSTCSTPILSTDNTNCETQGLLFTLGNADTAWWVSASSNLVEQISVNGSLIPWTHTVLLHSMQTSFYLRVNYTREPTHFDNIQLLPQNSKCSASVISFSILRSLQRRECGTLNPNGDSPSDLSWEDINASWVAVAYFVLITGFYMGTYFDAWRMRVMLGQVYQVAIMQAQIPVILHLTWSTLLIVNVVAILVPFFAAFIQFIYTFRVAGERSVGFPAKTRVEAWKTLLVCFVLTIIILIYTHVQVEYNL